MLQAIMANFSHYNVAELIALLHAPSFYMTILSLIILEATLSCDNAVVLAIVVKHLPPEQQKKALHYGIVGAYLFRFIAIGLGTLLVKLWWVKAIGGGYLLYMALKFFYGRFFSKDDNEDGVPDNVQKGLLATIATVEMMDIAFSADSVLAAFGVSESVWVLLIGGMLGILCMRYAAQLFITLLEHVPELEDAAYILILVIGAKMLAAITAFPIPFTSIVIPGLGMEMVEWGFFAIMGVTFAGAFGYNKLKKAQEATA